MALFKILKGESTRLSAQKAKEGYAYFTPDDGKFYIDIAGDGTQDAIMGNKETEEVNRICINQRLFTYNDYDILDCGDATSSLSLDTIIFNCGDSMIVEE